MKCKNAEILISAAADGELSQGETLALGEHLASCAKCRREQKTVTGLRRALTVWESSEPAESLANVFAMRLSREREAQTRGWRKWSFSNLPAYGLASAATVVILAAVFIATMRPVVQPPSVSTNRPAAEKSRPAVIATQPSVQPKRGNTIAPIVEAALDRIRRVASASQSVRPRHTGHFGLRRHEAMEHYTVALAPGTANAAKAISDSAKQEAARRIAEKAAKLRTLIAEANTTIEEAVIGRDTQSNDVTQDYTSKSDESPS
jgi:hypothetical protein